MKKLFIDFQRKLALVFTYLLLFIFLCILSLGISFVLVGSFWIATLVFFPGNPITVQAVLGVCFSLGFLGGVILFFRTGHPEVT